MGTILFALHDDEPDDQLVAAANRYADGTDTDILLTRFMDKREYQEDIQEKATSRERGESIEDLRQTGEDEAGAIAENAFGSDVSYATHAVLGRDATDVLRVADEYDCEHVFITGTKRSPSGKVLFGDLAQQVLLNYDGPVTVTTGSP